MPIKGLEKGEGVWGTERFLYWLGSVCSAARLAYYRFRLFAAVTFVKLFYGLFVEFYLFGFYQMDGYSSKAAA